MASSKDKPDSAPMLSTPISKWLEAMRKKGAIKVGGKLIFTSKPPKT